MKNLFACLLLLSLVICLSAVGEGFQKRRPAAKRGAKRELSPKSKRSANSESKLTGKDAEINSFRELMDAFTAELVRKVESAKNPAQGVNRAQEYLEARRAEIKAKFDAVKCISESEVREDTEKNLSEHFYNNGIMLARLQVKYGADPDVLAKLRKLTADYLDILEAETPCPKREPIASNPSVGAL